MGEPKAAKSGGATQALLSGTDTLINWARQHSLWPLFIGLSCCFVEEATVFTSRYDIGRFGAEVFRGSPRQADLLIVSGTVFKKVAPVVLRLYEQMPEPKWVISMGSCCNSGGMYDVYSVVQGLDQIIPVDLYVPGCPPRPEALLYGLTKLQEKIAHERPTRPSLHLAGGHQGGRRKILVDGKSKSRDSRGPGYQDLPPRGTSVTPPWFEGSRVHTMWTPPAQRVEVNEADQSLSGQLVQRFGDAVRPPQPTADLAAHQVAPERAKEVLAFLKNEASPRFQRLDDLCVVDESARQNPGDHPDFTLVYHLLSYDAARRIRLKVPLTGPEPAADSVTEVWPSANWYEREAWDMMGVKFRGHPNLERILTPPGWEGHPLRKSQPGRSTELAAFTRADARRHQPRDAAELVRQGPDEFLLNMGPHHYSTHGLLRIALSLHGEEIRDLALDIGYHHRGVEKIGERQSWHQFLPYTDRVDYLAGLANELAYLQAVEGLAGIKVPDRALFIRVMMAELFRISNHLVYYGTMVQDLGAMTPIFYAFRERELIMDIAERVTGGRLHPSWFRLGGVAMDLPDGWREPIDHLLKIMPQRLEEYEAVIAGNPILLARVEGIGQLSRQDAIDWGVTGPNLRATGVDWDLRRDMPYSAYAAFHFEVPTASEGDCLARFHLRLAEIRQSLAIIRQAVDQMPPGPYISPDSRYVLPVKRDALQDIESLIHHFVNATRGPKIPAGECLGHSESPRGEQGYYVTSDGLNRPYRLRLRTPGFAHLQAIPLMARGASLADLVAILGSWDFILPDVDR